MPVTFGSVGDIIAVGLLIHDLAQALSESSGSASEYQALISDLRALESLLKDVQELADHCDKVGGYESLSARAKIEVLAWKRPIEDFKSLVDKYSASLRIGGSGNSTKDAMRKVQWRLTISQRDLKTFRQFVRDRLQFMNAVIETAKYKSELVSEQVLITRIGSIEMSSGATQTAILDLKRQVEALQQSMVAQTCQLARLEQSTTNISAYAGLYLVGLVVRNTWQCAISIVGQIPRLINPWMGKPALLHDMNDRIAPIPLDLIDSWAVLESVLRARFANQPNEEFLNNEAYFFRDSIAGDIILPGSSDFKATFQPGKTLVMTALNSSPTGLVQCISCRRHPPAGYTVNIVLDGSHLEHVWSDLLDYRSSESSFCHTMEWWMDKTAQQNLAPNLSPRSGIIWTLDRVWGVCPWGCKSWGWMFKCKARKPPRPNIATVSSVVFFPKLALEMQTS